jgi:diguanylate cyclase (GGDEF)-like protein
MITVFEQLAALRQIFELIREPAYIVDSTSTRIVDANPAGCDILCTTRSELLGQPWGPAEAQLGDVRRCEIDRRYFVVIQSGLSPQRLIQDPAVLDALTGLRTRAALREHSDVDDRWLPAALLFIDLDGFKQVNDSLGHLAGDQVLRIVGQRLLKAIRRGDLAIRYGGDEFLVVVDNLLHRRDIWRLERRIERSLRRPIAVDGVELTIFPSIGVARRHSAGTSLAQLIAEADRAMYQAKYLKSSQSSSCHRPQRSHGSDPTIYYASR